MADPTCRSCGSSLTQTFVDLGMSPLSNSYLTADQCRRMEPFYPLHAYVCGSCFLVQLEEFEAPERIFSDYAYFSSYSETWLAHAQRYADDAIAALSLGGQSRVIEIASNDGYLLQYFKASGVPVLGIEPAANVAEAAVARGIPTRVQFHGEATARALVAEGIQADLVVANNVLAHVPDLNDFLRGAKILLKPHGRINMEFPHLLQLMSGNQFDTIYHEHFSYFSLLSVEEAFRRNGLVVYDVEELPTHGGSLRLHAAAAEGRRSLSRRLEQLREREAKAGLHRLSTYGNFSAQVHAVKRALLQFLIEAKAKSSSVAAYGAAAKGNTLLNYCGIRTDLIDYVVDRNPHKQRRFLPGTHIPIHAPSRVEETRPEFLLILPWNLRDEVMQQMDGIRAWGGRFVVPIPTLQIL